jgi:2-polyprenyl-6-methoxyphenol hydroxylase-like FAD-dependent oxidoreductase
MDIAVFGAGIAGLMSAITLQEQGHRCRVYERSRNAHDAGMGFILLPEGIRCLQSFGVEFAGDASGSPLHRYFCRDSRGQVVFQQAIPAGARGIRRRDLITALIRAVGDDGTLVYGKTLEHLELRDSSEVAAAGLKSATGSSRIEADLYIGAEGVNSRARQALFPDWPIAVDRVPEIVGLVRCDKATAWAAQNLNKFHAEEGGIALGVLPVGDDHIVWYVQFDSLRFPMSRAVIDGKGRAGAEARGDFVKKLVGGWAHPIPSLLEATDFSGVHLWRPVDTDLIPLFHRGNLALVGDAAHPLSPFTSQGVSTAIADAVALAVEIDGVKSTSDVERALARYSAERRKPCALHVAQGRELSERFLEPLSKNSGWLPIAVRIGARHRRSKRRRITAERFKNAG